MTVVCNNWPARALHTESPHLWKKNPLEKENQQLHFVYRNFLRYL